MWKTVAELHAALNDLPAALFLASLVFDVAGQITKRDSLRAAGFWTLVGSAAGAVLALASGLRAEAIIDHGPSMHRFIERHETLAIGFTVLVLGLTAWRVVRRGTLPAGEIRPYLALGLVGLLGLVWTAKVGGNIMFRHAGGIETEILEAAIAERRVTHAHAPGEEDHEHAPGAAEHDHDAGEPEHEHPADSDTAAAAAPGANHVHD